jgi:transposase
MRQKSNSTPASSETLVRNIRRATRKHHAAEEKIRIVLDGLRGETSIAELCRREGIAESMYYSWSKEFLEAGKRRLAADTARAATTDEVKQLRREAQDLKEVVAEQALELQALVKDFEEGGEAAIKIMRIERKCIASLLPKELDINDNRLAEIPGDELEFIIEHTRRQLAARLERAERREDETLN